MKKILTLFISFVLACGTLAVLPSCNNATSSDPVIALITLHGESSTYDKNFIDAFKAACKAKGLKEGQYKIQSNVPEEGEECYEAAVGFVEEGFKAVFADSFGHEANMIKAAKANPNVQFCHATGTKAHTENLSNYHNAFASIYEGRYLAGVAAGLKLVELYGGENGEVANENAVVGYVAAWPYAEVISGYTSWFLGVRSVVPNATMKVSYTSSWYDEAKEGTVATSLIEQGCKLISQHADSMGAPNACDKAGVPNVSYNGGNDLSTFVISSRINWQPYFELMIESVTGGAALPADWTGTIETGSVELSAVGKAAAAGTQAKLDEVAAKLADGSLKVFDCRKFTVDGASLTSFMADIDDDGTYSHETEIIATAKDAEGNDYYYVNESSKRSAPAFDQIIDGITIL